MGLDSVAWQGFAPEVPAGHEPFWESVHEHRIRLQRCVKCRELRFVPAEICSRCWSSEADWTPISGAGTVYTFTTVHRAPTPGYQAMAPYVIAHVSLVEGPRMISHLVTDDSAAAIIGMSVRIAYEDVSPDLTLYVFRPA